MLDIKVEMLEIEMDDEMITRLLNQLKEYQVNSETAPIGYVFFPIGIQRAHNSNSFVRGMLEAADYESEDIPTPSYSAPGYNSPVSEKYYERNNKERGFWKNLINAPL